MALPAPFVMAPLRTGKFCKARSTAHVDVVQVVRGDAVVRQVDPEAAVEVDLVGADLVAGTGSGVERDAAVRVQGDAVACAQRAATEEVAARRVPDVDATEIGDGGRAGGIVPMKFPPTLLPVEPRTLIVIPMLPFPEITLRAPGAVPPIVLFVAAPKVAMPWNVLPSAAVPVRFRPM